MYSSKRPYLDRKDSILAAQTKDTRFLSERQGFDRESELEKPYGSGGGKGQGSPLVDYQSMHLEKQVAGQSGLATPPPGGIFYTFVPNICSYGIECVADEFVKIVGGPYQDEAGWLPPHAIQGEIKDWSVSPDSKIMTVNPVHPCELLEHNKPIVRVQYRDGWGQVVEEIIDIGVCYYSGNYINVSHWDTGHASHVGTWDGTKWNSVFAFGANLISLIPSGTWAQNFRFLYALAEASSDLTVLDLRSASGSILQSIPYTQAVWNVTPIDWSGHADFTEVQFQDDASFSVTSLYLSYFTDELDYFPCSPEAKKT